MGLGIGAGGVQGRGVLLGRDLYGTDTRQENGPTSSRTKFRACGGRMEQDRDANDFHLFAGN